MNKYRTETVIVRLSDTYGPGEYYSPYRNFICRFIYYALKEIPYTVYLNHKNKVSLEEGLKRTIAWMHKVYIKNVVDIRNFL